jgi:hypothetical protein
MLIKFYDNEGYEYPLIEIEEGCTDKFQELLDKYRKANDDYTYDGFLSLLSEQDWFVCESLIAEVFF